MADTAKIVEQLSGLTVLEIAGLVKELEDKWGVKAAPVAVAAPGVIPISQSRSTIARASAIETIAALPSWSASVTVSVNPRRAYVLSSARRAL